MARAQATRRARAMVERNMVRGVRCCQSCQRNLLQLPIHNCWPTYIGTTARNSRDERLKIGFASCVNRAIYGYQCIRPPSTLLKTQHCSTLDQNSLTMIIVHKVGCANEKFWTALVFGVAPAPWGGKVRLDLFAAAPAHLFSVQRHPSSPNLPPLFSLLALGKNTFETCFHSVCYLCDFRDTMGASLGQKLSESAVK